MHTVTLRIASRHIPEVGAVCGTSARTDLHGGEVGNCHPYRDQQASSCTIHNDKYDWIRGGGTNGFVVQPKLSLVIPGTLTPITVAVKGESPSAFQAHPRSGVGRRLPVATATGRVKSARLSRR